MRSDGFVMFLITLIGLATYLFAGCAGPSTPLGAPWATNTAETRNGPLALLASIFRTQGSEIRFSPAHQNQHGASPLTVHIHDPNGIRNNYRLVVRHNGLDVTQSFLRQASVAISSNDIKIHVPLLRLPADNEHLIEFIYSGANDLNAYARYQAPICHAFDKKQIRTTDGFAPEKQLLSAIVRISALKGFNPAFTAGLIAQESGFNPRTVSWAKAIGLTQVTTVAENEVVDEYSEWPRYPGINELPAFFVKALVFSGHVNRHNEWRVNEEMSIYGGLTFAQSLSDRWSAPDNMAKIKATFEDPDTAVTRLVLASYNSGYARVSNALARYGANWLAAPELKEARKYVNRISSYCDHFSEIEEAHHEDQT